MDEYYYKYKKCIHCKIAIDIFQKLAEHTKLDIYVLT